MAYVKMTLGLEDWYLFSPYSKAFSRWIACASRNCCISQRAPGLRGAQMWVLYTMSEVRGAIEQTPPESNKGLNKDAYPAPPLGSPPGFGGSSPTRPTELHFGARGPTRIWCKRRVARIRATKLHGPWSELLT